MIQAEIKIMGKENETQYDGEITIQNNWDVKESLILYFFQAAVHTVSSSWELFVIFTIETQSLVLYLWAGPQKPKNMITFCPTQNSKFTTNFFNNYSIAAMCECNRLWHARGAVFIHCKFKQYWKISAKDKICDLGLIWNILLQTEFWTAGLDLAF